MRSPESWTPFLLRFGLRSLAGALFDNMTNMVNLGYNAFMRTVKIGDLKAQLSAHLQFVRNGEEVLVCDREKPVARIIPCEIEGLGEQEFLVERAIRIATGKAKARAKSDNQTKKTVCAVEGCGTELSRRNRHCLKDGTEICHRCHRSNRSCYRDCSMAISW